MNGGALLKAKRLSRLESNLPIWLRVCFLLNWAPVDATEWRVANLNDSILNFNFNFNFNFWFCNEQNRSRMISQCKPQNTIVRLLYQKRRTLAEHFWFQTVRCCERYRTGFWTENFFVHTKKSFYRKPALCCRVHFLLISHFLAYNRENGKERVFSGC